MAPGNRGQGAPRHSRVSSHVRSHLFCDPAVVHLPFGGDDSQVRGPLGRRKRHIVARSCQAGIFGLWLAGGGGSLLTGLHTGILSMTGASLLPATFLRLCQVAPLMALAGIGLVAIIFYIYPYPPEDENALTRENRAA